MEKQNISLSIPKDILLKVKFLAVKQGTSISALMIQACEDIAASEEGYQTAQHRHVHYLEQGVNLGTQGSIHWNRDVLHAR